MVALRNAQRWMSRRGLNLADERGDVPGWVLIAVMTAGLVTAIWLIADGQFSDILGRALSSVSGP
jgi:hypothetical protein